MCHALLGRQKAEIQRLLKHSLARTLPQRVREEIQTILRARPNNMMVPIHTLHFYHTTAQLVLEENEPATANLQLELPLHPTSVAYELNVTLARARLLPHNPRSQDVA